MHFTRMVTLLLLATVAVLPAGCSPPAAIVVYRPGYFVEKPDVILVRLLRPTHEEAQKDADLLPAWIRENRPEPQTAEDVKAGRNASLLVSEQIVAALQARGIPATLATGGQTATAKTATIVGQFVNQESASGDLRPSIGFRVDQAIDIRLQLIQNRQIIGELKAQGVEKDVTAATTNIARQVADVIEQAYIKNGWLAAPIKR